MKVDKRLRLVELYAGTARSTQPFLSWRRSVPALLIDKDPVACRTYLHNFPRAPYLLGDLTRITADTLVWLAGGRIDILLGCPPCQGFSDTGSRDPHDPRNSHMTLFGRIAEHIKPLAVAMENVPLAAGTGQFKYLVRRLERAGYLWTAAIANAALHGSTQCRQRLVYIGIRKDVGAAPVLSAPTHGGAREYYSYSLGSMRPLDSDRIGMLGEAPATQRLRRELPHVEDELGSQTIPYLNETLDGLPRIGTRAARELGHVSWGHSRKLLRRMGAVADGARWSGGDDHFSQSYGRLHRRGLARTITTYFANPGSGRFWHPTSNRALTLREAARLQGFPDTFHFPLPAAARLVGNALDGAIANLIYRSIRAALE
jgi:DNA (cytosine-5)-methyltransferase 1